MKLATKEDIREIDRKTIERYKVPGLLLMENAGRACADVICKEFPFANQIVIICGGGNNGGDGFVIARQLISRGKKVTTYITKNKKEYKGDAKTNLDSLLKISDSVVLLDKSNQRIKKADLYVDAIFGTGLDKEVEGIYKKIITYLNSLDAPCICIDIPSGLDCNSGRPLGCSVIGDITITFITPKIGMCIYPGVDYVGKLYIANITTNKELEKNLNSELLTFEKCRKILKNRKSDSHKGTHGHLIIIAGSRGKSGAATLCAGSSLKIGSGLVTVAVPSGINNVVECKTTEAMSVSLDETEQGTFSLTALPQAIKILNEKKSALAIGPGITTNEEVKKFFEQIVHNCEIPIVADADAINIIADNITILKKITVPVILTPHPGEMARLCKSSIKEVQDNRIKISMEFAKKHNCYLVLKGARTIIATPDGNIYINPTGNPGMATGGMGDVLTGMIGGLLAQGYTPLESTILGTFLHGYAGDLEAEENGFIGMEATSLIEKISLSIKSIQTQKEKYFEWI